MSGERAWARGFSVGVIGATSLSLTVILRTVSPLPSGSGTSVIAFGAAWSSAKSWMRVPLKSSSRAPGGGWGRRGHRSRGRSGFGVGEGIGVAVGSGAGAGVGVGSGVGTEPEWVLERGPAPAWGWASVPARGSEKDRAGGGAGSSTSARRTFGRRRHGHTVSSGANWPRRCRSRAPQSGRASRGGGRRGGRLRGVGDSGGLGQDLHVTLFGWPRPSWEPASRCLDACPAVGVTACEVPANQQVGSRGAPPGNYGPVHPPGRALLSVSARRALSEG